MGQVGAKEPHAKRGHDRPAAGGPEPVDRNVGLPVVWPEPGDWHPGAARWYASLATSGQAAYYQPSDAAQAWLLAELLSLGLQHDTPQYARMWLTGARELLTTEGARRAAHLRLDPTAGGVDDLAEVADDMMNVIKGEFGERRSG